MKSIKEMAEEYAKEFIEPFVLYYSQDEVKQFEAQHEDSFEAGANYVLEQIEQLIYEKHVKGNLPLFDLTFFIDKLKEE